MKKLLLALAITLAPLAAHAESFTYSEMCWYKGKQNQPRIEKTTCNITDVRLPNGSLDRRTIVANLNSGGNPITYIVESWFDNRGFVTWDSDSNREYQISYSVAPKVKTVAAQAQLPSGYAITAVNKDLWVRQISWD